MSETTSAVEATTTGELASALAAVETAAVAEAAAEDPVVEAAASVPETETITVLEAISSPEKSSLIGVQLEGTESNKLTVNIYQDSVGVMHAGGETFKSIPDFINSLQRATGMEEDTVRTVVLPDGVFQYGQNKNTIEMNLYYPERKVTLHHMDSKYEVMLPNVIIYHMLRWENDFWQVVDTRFMCTDKAVGALPEMVPDMIRRQNNSRNIWNLPIPNMYEDCKMCFGGNTPPVRFGANLRGLQFYYDIIFESPFNNDLSIRGIQHSSTPSTWLKFWRDAGDKFPYDQFR